MYGTSIKMHRNDNELSIDFCCDTIQLNIIKEIRRENLFYLGSTRDIKGIYVTLVYAFCMCHHHYVDTITKTARNLTFVMCVCVCIQNVIFVSAISINVRLKCKYYNRFRWCKFASFLCGWKYKEFKCGYIESFDERTSILCFVQC